MAQSSSIRACLGVDPPLVKLIDDSFVIRIVSLSTAVKYYEEKLRSKLEEIYREETRKTYLKKKVPNVPKERLILLKKIKFAEKLQEKNKELEIKLDIESENIYFEGPLRLVREATEMLQKQMSDMVEKTFYSLRQHCGRFSLRRRANESKMRAGKQQCGSSVRYWQRRQGCGHVCCACGQCREPREEAFGNS